MTYYFFVASFVFPTVLGATTIVGVSPIQTNPSNAYVLSGTSDDLDVSWTSSVSYTNVNMSANLSVITADSTPWSLEVTAFLTNAIGPAANATNVLFSSSLTLSGNPGTSGAFGPFPTTLFQNLTLSPGTYNLVLTATGDSLRTVGLEESNLLDPTFAVIAGPGVSNVLDRYAEAIAGGGVLDPTFAPGSTFLIQPIANFNVAIVGDPTPEPATFGYLALGIALFAWPLRNRYRRRASGEALTEPSDSWTA